MAAYVIVETEITDPGKYEEYRKRAPAAISKFGGKYLVRGGTLSVLEGDWKPSRLVVLEFPTLKAAQECFQSPDYLAAKQYRQGAARMRVIAVEGT
jgi:uncharacterized protein (DUF1330 family)